jgi:hypothetical protein
VHRLNKRGTEYTSSWTTCPCILMPKFANKLPTGSSRSIPMLLTLAHPKLAVTPVDTFFSAAFPKMIHQSSSMAPSILPAQFSSWLLHLPLKLNLVPSSLMHKKPRSYDLSSKNLATLSHPFPFTSIIQQLLAL